MNINVSSWLLSFFNLRERVVTKFGCNEKKCPKVTYLIFLTGFHWRISLLSRANGFCTVFNAGLKDFFGVLRVSVVLSLARSKMAIVRLPPDLPRNYLVLYLLPLRGREPHFRLGSPANHLASFSPSPSDVRRPKVT